MKSFKVKWTGIRPLVMHCGLLADPLNPYTIKIKAITKKRAKAMGENQTDHAAVARLEWEGGLYWDSEAGPHMPAENIHRCIQKGGAKDKAGKLIAAAVIIADDIIPVKYDGPRDMDKLYADPRFTLRMCVVINKMRVVRIRPMFPTGWNITFTVEYDEDNITEETILNAMINAGALCGLGDNRPRFGRFLVEKLNGK